MQISQMQNQSQYANNHKSKNVTKGGSREVIAVMRAGIIKKN